MSRHWTVRSASRGARVETASVVSLLQDLAETTSARAAVRFIPDPEWREVIYDRERLAGRLGLMFVGEWGAVFALNLYRDLDLGDFGADEVARFRKAAPLLRTALRPHLGNRVTTVAARVSALEQRLCRRAPLLALRERAVAATDRLRRRPGRGAVLLR